MLNDAQRNSLRIVISLIEEKMRAMEFMARSSRRAGADVRNSQRFVPGYAAQAMRQSC